MVCLQVLMHQKIRAAPKPHKQVIAALPRGFITVAILKVCLL